MMHGRKSIKLRKYKTSRGRVISNTVLYLGGAELKSFRDSSASYYVRGFTQCDQENDRLVIQIKPWPLPHTSFAIHFSLFLTPSDRTRL
jgi:hypothetical protein